MPRLVELIADVNRQTQLSIVDIDNSKKSIAGIQQRLPPARGQSPNRMSEAFVQKPLKPGRASRVSGKCRSSPAQFPDTRSRPPSPVMDHIEAQTLEYQEHLGRPDPVGDLTHESQVCLQFSASFLYTPSFCRTGGSLLRFVQIVQLCFGLDESSLAYQLSISFPSGY